MEVRWVLSVVIVTNSDVKVPRKKLRQLMDLIHEPSREKVMNLLSRLWRALASTSSDTPERVIAQLLCRDPVRTEPELFTANLTSFTESGTHNTRYLAQMGL
jgi:hypothetical protein